MPFCTLDELCSKSATFFIFLKKIIIFFFYFLTICSQQLPLIGTAPGAWTFPKARRKAEVLKWSRPMPKLIRLELVLSVADLDMI